MMEALIVLMMVVIAVGLYVDVKGRPERHRKAHEKELRMLGFIDDEDKS